MNYKKSNFEHRGLLATLKQNTHVHTTPQFATRPGLDINRRASGTRALSQSKMLVYREMHGGGDRQNKCGEVAAQLSSPIDARMRVRVVGCGRWGSVTSSSSEGRETEQGENQVPATHHFPLYPFGKFSGEAHLPFLKSRQTFRLPPSKETPPAGCGSHSRTVLIIEPLLLCSGAPSLWLQTLCLLDRCGTWARLLPPPRHGLPLCVAAPLASDHPSESGDETEF